MLDFGLVRMDLREREILLRIAPHLVRPLEFLIPFYDRSLFERAKLRAGMMLYETLSFDKTLPSYRILSRADVLECEPGLHERGLQGGATYFDAQVSSPERLAIENIIDARAHGAQALNYCEVVGAIKDARRVTGVQVRDTLTGEETEVRARMVVNASGAWFDRVARTIESGAAPRIRTTKGVHIACPPVSQRAVVLFSPIDARLFFVIPWLGLGWIGTTDTDFQGDPGEACATPADVSYLAKSTAEFFSRFKTSEVYWTNAGVRALVMQPGHPSAVSRTHRVEIRPGLISVLGGKITGYRAIAQDVTDRVGRLLGARRPCTTLSRLLPGASEALGSNDLAQLASRARSEQCIHLSDFMLRRTTLGFGRDQGWSIAMQAASLLAAELGWDDARREAEIREYAARVERTYAPCTPAG
jgi:glycerol-3-phosphate dehydrogenase